MARAKQTREALIQAAIEEVERVGLAQITVRGICQRAGANVAAINYHFGSKDGLIRAVLEATWAHMFADAEAILAGAMTASMAMSGPSAAPPPRTTKKTRAATRRALVELMTYLLEGAQRYPQLTQAHVQDGFNKPGRPTELMSDFGGLVPKVAAAVRKAVRGLSTAHAEQRSVAALSSILFLGFFPTFFGTSSPATPAARRRHVETVVDALLAEPLSRAAFVR